MNWFWPETGRGSHRDPPHPRPPRATARRGWVRIWLPPLLLAAGWLSPGVPRAAALDPRRSLTQYQRQTWGPEQGMPCNNVLSVIQGSDGYLWLGTEEGLVRFDGVRTRVFDHHTDPALVNNSVYSVTEDLRHPGAFLLGSAGGLCRYAEGKVSVYQSNAELAGFSGVVMLQDPADDTLWVRSARGIFHVHPDGRMTAAAATLPDGKVRTVCRDGRGHLWVGTAEGLHRQRGVPSSSPGAALDFEPVPGWEGKGVDSLCPARGGGVWVGSRDGGSGWLEEDGVFHPRPALAGCTVTRILEDRAGMLWVATNGSGLFRLPVREGDSATGPSVLALTTENGLAHNLVNGLCEDREGNLWIATQLGLQVLRDVRFVNFGRPEGLAGDDVRSIFEDAHGQIWIGNENGLGRLDPTGEQVTSFPMPPSPLRPGNDRVLCVGEGDGKDEDGVWAGTTAGLVSWREGRIALLPLRDDLDRSAVRALSRDAAGDRWVGTNTGLYQVRGRRVQARFTAAEGLANDSVRGLHADGQGNLWVATSGGLSRRAADGRITNYLNFGPGRGDGTVLCFLPDPARAGDLLVGTEFGLHRVHLAADGRAEVRAYSEREGLFDNILWGLVADDRGNLWMSCNKGVSRVARADLARFDRGEISRIPHVVYGVADGMRSRECNGGHQPAACRDRAGRLWFATVKGAAMVDPAHVDLGPLPPPVHVEEMTADTQTLPGEAGETDKPLLKLPPGTQKLGFRYTALSLVAPESNRFRYRLEGYDADWTNAKTERTARYTNLPPGLYRFLVQAASADGAWTPEPASFQFRLRPFFYHTAWFRALVLAAGWALLWGAQFVIRRRWQGRLARAEAELRERTRTQEVLREAKEEADRGRQVARLAQVEAETARQEAERANRAKSEFLSRLSHELRTPLNAILGFGQLLEMEPLPRPQQESVRLILGGGRHLLGLVDEILDLSSVESGAARVRCEAVELAPLLAEVMAMIEPLARARGVTLQVAADVSSATPFWADGQRLKQVLLNLLSNAVKYNRADGGEVFVGLAAAATGDAAATSLPPGTEAPGARRRVFVRDTGSGIDAASLTKLFTPFERLGAAYGPIEGTGLGLAVSKQLVEAMGGSLGVESTPGVGSTFWVDLPSVAPAPSPAEAEPPGMPPPASDSAAAVPRPPIDDAPAQEPPPGASLLYIEDNASNRHLVQTILARHRPDLHLRCAPDGTAGLLAARTPPRPGLILLDLQLPDLRGDEVLGRLREDDATLGIPVVVLSADATGDSRGRLRAAGAAGYLTKPLALPPLLELLAGYFPAGDPRPGSPTSPAPAASRPAGL